MYELVHAVAVNFGTCTQDAARVCEQLSQHEGTASQREEREAAVPLPHYAALHTRLQKATMHNVHAK